MHDCEWHAQTFFAVLIEKLAWGIFRVMCWQRATSTQTPRSGRFEAHTVTPHYVGQPDLLFHLAEVDPKVTHFPAPFLREA